MVLRFTGHLVQKFISFSFVFNRLCIHYSIELLTGVYECAFDVYTYARVTLKYPFLQNIKRSEQCVNQLLSITALLSLNHVSFVLTLHVTKLPRITALFSVSYSSFLFMLYVTNLQRIAMSLSESNVSVSMLFLT